MAVPWEGHMVMPRFDLYRELEVDRQASVETIEAAYRSLMKRHHPDLAAERAPGRSERLNVARDWLTDPARRAAYDASLMPRGARRADGGMSTARAVAFRSQIVTLAGLAALGLGLATAALAGALPYGIQLPVALAGLLGSAAACGGMLAIIVKHLRAAGGRLDPSGVARQARSARRP